MNKNLKVILGISAFIIFLVIAYFAYNSLSKNYNNTQIVSEANSDNSSSSETEAELIKAPDFTVVDVDDNEVKLSDYIGKPIVLNFWASWCPPCKAEFPEFEKVYNEQKDDVTFLMINMTDGQRETKEKGLKYITDNEYTLPIYFDTKQEASFTYGIVSIPTTLFINTDGNIVSAKQGQISEKTLNNEISNIKE